MTSEATGTGWFRTFGPLFIGGETTRHYGGVIKTEWRIGLNFKSRAIECSWSVRNWKGQGLAEYALILALIAIVAIVALLYLGGSISAILNTIASQVGHQPGASP